MLYNQFYDKKIFIPFNYIFPLVLHKRLHEVERRWHHHLWQHTRLDYIKRGMPSSPLDNKTWSDNIGRGMPSSPLDSKTWYDTIGRGIPSWPMGNIHGNTTLAVAMPSSPLECTHSRMTSSMACHHRPWKNTRSNEVWRGMLSFTFENTHDWTTCGMGCPHGT